MRGVAAAQGGVVLVTGARGFLGRYCVHRLTAAGYRVVGVGRSALPPEAPLAACEYRQIDLTDPHSVQTLVAAGGLAVEALVHLAAVFPASLNADDATACGERNLQMDGHVLQASDRLRCRVVFASSASVYPTESPNENREDGPTLQNVPYAREKLATERGGLRRWAARGTSFASLRITAPYGPGQTTRTVLRLFIDRAVEGAPIRFHGTGRREQDFVHAADVAEAVACAVARRAHGIFNIGSGSPVTMRELASLVARAVPECGTVPGPSGAEDPQETRFARFSIAKAGEELGWLPRVLLADGVADWARMLLRPSNAHSVSV